MDKEPSAAQIATFTPIITTYFTNFMKMDPAVQLKYKQASDAEKDKPIHEREQVMKAMELFDVADVNGDGVLDKAELAEHLKMINKLRDENYGDHPAMTEEEMNTFFDL